MLKVFVDWGDELWSARIIMAAYLAIGLGLLVQPSRFTRTPSYANLLILAGAPTWGILYLLSALSLALWLGLQPTQPYEPNQPRWGIAAHMIPIALTAGWLIAFVVRYLSDTATTIVNVVSWSVFLALLGHSEAMVFREPPVGLPPQPVEGEGVGDSR
jgi:hypothetical protein